MSEQVRWLDTNFIQRLHSRASQPGVVRLDMGREVVARLAQMGEQHALLQELGQRWQSSLMAQSEQVPIVYARPAVSEPVVNMKTAVSQKSHQSQTAKPIVTPNKRTRLSSKSTVAMGKRPLSQPSQPTQTTKPIHAANKTAMTPSRIAETHLPDQKPRTGSLPTSKKPDETAVSQKPIPQTKIKVTQGKTAVSLIKPQPSSSGVDTPLSLAEPSQSQTSSKLNITTAKAIQTQLIVQGQTLPLKRGTVKAGATSKKSTSQDALDLAMPSSRTAVSIAISGQKSQPRAASAMPVVKPQPTTPRRSASKAASPAVKSASSNRIVSGNRPLGDNLTNRLPIVRPFHTSPKQGTTQMPLSAKPAPRATATPAITSRPRPTMSAASNVIQRQVDETASGGETAVSPAVNISEIVDEVQRQFMRQLAIEGERRGVALC